MRIFNKNLFNGISAKTKLLVLVLLSINLLSCSSSDEDPDLIVAELTDLENQFDPDIKWESSVGDGVESYFSRIKPVSDTPRPRLQKTFSLNITYGARSRFS